MKNFFENSSFCFQNKKKARAFAEKARVFARNLDKSPKMLKIWGNFSIFHTQKSEGARIRTRALKKYHKVVKLVFKNCSNKKSWTWTLFEQPNNPWTTPLVEEFPTFLELCPKFLTFLSFVPSLWRKSSFVPKFLGFVPWDKSQKSPNFFLKLKHVFWDKARALSHGTKLERHP